jgi:hypothetical protein
MDRRLDIESLSKRNMMPLLPLYLMYIQYIYVYIYMLALVLSFSKFGGCYNDFQINVVNLIINHPQYDHKWVVQSTNHAQFRSLP